MYRVRTHPKVDRLLHGKTMHILGVAGNLFKFRTVSRSGSINQQVHYLSREHIEEVKRDGTIRIYQPSLAEKLDPVLNPIDEAPFLRCEECRNRNALDYVRTGYIVRDLRKDGIYIEKRCVRCYAGKTLVGQDNVFACYSIDMFNETIVPIKQPTR